MQQVRGKRRPGPGGIVRLGFNLFAASALWLATPAHVAGAGAEFDPDTEYRITIQAGNGAETLAPVRVGEVVEIGSRAFLAVYLSGYKTRGYVDLSSVRSILPAKQ